MTLADWIRLAPTAAEVSRLNGWFDRRCADSGIEKALAADMKLCVNEVLANLISYGFAKTANPWMVVKIRLRPGRAVARIIDNGSRFDLRDWGRHPERDRPSAEPGGYGIALIKERASKVTYYRFCGINRLKIICKN